MPGQFPCRCCGFHTLSTAELGSYEICPVCFWEDDLADDSFGHSSNGVTLEEAQSNFEAYGACGTEWRNDVRPPTPDEARATDWLPLRDVLAAARTATEAQIAVAFGSLRIGRGMRLYDAELVDDYGHEGPFALARKQDDYQTIGEVPDEGIAQCYSSLSFFDAPGLRFHIGAYMSWVVRNPKAASMTTDFTVYALEVGKEELRDWSEGRFAIFDRAQCEAVVAFLLLASRDSEMDQQAALRALPYWQARLL